MVSFSAKNVHMLNTTLSHVGTGGVTCACATEVDVLVENVIDNPYREDNIIVSTHLDHADLMVTAPQSLKPNTYIKYAISGYLVNADDYKSLLCYADGQGNCLWRRL